MKHLRQVEQARRKIRRWNTDIRSHLQEYTTKYLSTIDRGLDSNISILTTVALGVAALVIPASLPNWCSVSSHTAVTILATLSGAGITTLAIFYALSNFRIQSLSQKLPSELVSQITTDTPWYRATYCRLVVITIAGLLALAPISSTDIGTSTINVITLNLALLLVTLIKLPRAVNVGVGRSYSETVVRAVLKRSNRRYFATITTYRGGIRPSSATGVLTLSTDEFSLVEQIAARAMRDGDLTTANLLMRTITGAVTEYVAHHSVMNDRAVLGWLGELYDVVGRKGLTLEPRVTEIIATLAGEVLGNVFELQRDWSDRLEYLEALKKLWDHSVSQKSDTVLDEFLYSHGRVFKIACNHVPAEATLESLYEDEQEKPKHDSKLEVEWQHFQTDFISRLDYFADSLATAALWRPFQTAQFVLRFMAWDVVENKVMGVRQKRVLLRWITWQAGRNIRSAIQKGANQEFVAWELDSTIHDEYVKQDMPDLIPYSINTWSEAIVDAARAGVLPWGVVNRLAADGRGYARTQKDELGAMVAETLGVIAMPLARHFDPEMRQRYLESAAALRSIGEWDKRSESELKNIVSEQLKNYEEEEERLRQWQKEVPSRRSLKRGNHHDFPWA